MKSMWDGGYWTAQSLKNLGPQRRLPQCNIEEVAAQYRLGSQAQHFDGRGTNKSDARRLVLDLFGPERYPDRVRVLTMPGRSWLFEAQLLRRRERTDLTRGPRPKRTKIHAVENDRAVYYEAMLAPPGMGHPSNVVIDRGRTPHAERIMSYYWVSRYLFTDVDELMKSDDKLYDCVWLDYFGPLSLERLATIRTFYDERVRGTLVVTSLKARWNQAMSRALSAHDDYESWLRWAFRGAEVEHYVEYFDTSPMVQMAVSKPRGFGVKDAVGQGVAT